MHTSWEGEIFSSMNNNDILLKKGLPSSPDSEMMVISALVNDPRTTLEILTENEIDDNYFTACIYKDIRGIVSKMVDCSHAVDIEGIAASLKHRKYSSPDISSAIFEIVDHFALATNLSFHLDNLKLYYYKRQSINKGVELIKKAYSSMDLAEFEPQSNNHILHKEILEYIASIEGEFSVMEIDKELLLNSKQQKNNRSKILSRLVKEAIIERIGRRSGNYRKIAKAKNEIAWQSASTSNAIDIKLPFNIDDLVYIFPKNIIVIAGEKDAGKTAFLLNVIELNMATHEILYLSSEMGDVEMASRLSKFDHIKKEDWKFKAIECASGFHDHILPSSINLIDYLEVTDEFWKVGESIRRIYDKLETGIAIIGLQKKSGSEYARGGEFSLEKARLYLTLQAGNKEKNSELKIVSAKNPKNDKPPRGKVIEYKLVQGCKFIKQNNYL